MRVNKTKIFKDTPLKIRMITYVERSSGKSLSLEMKLKAMTSLQINVNGFYSAKGNFLQLNLSHSWHERD